MANSRKGNQLVASAEKRTCTTNGLSTTLHSAPSVLLNSQQRNGKNATLLSTLKVTLSSQQRLTIRKP